ncbi:unnamed protein product [Didymodactylos carnosus]|uniref:Uncharacterized protein n=1 Tax=Didymodactylos carnosus TaxID=1234261 RepID=A0A815BN22_9BILA|nr:unnamed protein product [Didymodactylos carnosus]CAF1382765.1 unnamed protein product [Didymodactylos carnosus]CAF4061886.1 unnamed protein product [Didymodactylos carnosus]CAF4191120.1 unnamed protein product [Didymodactylos carnosus]
MYDRAPRNYQLVIGSTLDHVGPGTYDHRPKYLKEESYAPFLSLSMRGDVFMNAENPGPGHYDIRNNQVTTIKVGLNTTFIDIYMYSSLDT